MKECLVIIDVQNGFVSEKTKHIPDKVKALVEQKSFDYVVATKFCNVEGSPYINFMGWTGLLDEKSRQLYPGIEELCDRIFTKEIYSCFTQEFIDFLEKEKIEKLYFAGIDTDCCVLKSASDCFERNIPFEVLLNYCASNGGDESHKAAHLVMKRMLGRKAINLME